MKIFIYNNIIGNYCSGDYYFVADDRSFADTIANHHATKHNKEVNNNRNYMIEWDEDVREHEIKPGFLPLNRIKLDMEK